MILTVPIISTFGQIVQIILSSSFPHRTAAFILNFFRTAMIRLV